MKTMAINSKTYNFLRWSQSESFVPNISFDSYLRCGERHFTVTAYQKNKFISEFSLRYEFI
jgi:hypothetical protein